MGLERHLKRISRAMKPAFADTQPWSYHHVATGETVPFSAFLKHKSSEQDPIDKPTKRQKVPVVRAMGLPWTDDEIEGFDPRIRDTVTSPAGLVWEVIGADSRASGWTDLFVTEARQP